MKKDPVEPTSDLPLKLYNDDGDKFIIIGHRGASAYAPENTMSAFRMAAEMGAEMIELDIVLSKDGVPVVIHDETLDRTTNAKGLVSDYTLEELKMLDAGSWFSDEFKGEAIPTLEEVLEWAKGRVSVNIEVKTEAVTDEAEGGIESKALALVDKFGMREHVIFSSFDYRSASHIGALAPDVAKAILYEKSQSKGKSPADLAEEYSIQAFNCSFRELKSGWMSDMLAKEVPVLIYTVNDKKRMRSLINRGVSGIFSDKPDLLREAVENLWENN
ncbi:glycerophosphodiester phosphodiesterase [Gracilimonas aurantiaca]|uniref:glycerophosphodiester phosphodiesterase n=1 Tax=Gracilimonas aurantiaca TaxID=3234185 RepID=UPI00390C9A62